jgi:hypothetical protein
VVSIDLSPTARRRPRGGTKGARDKPRPTTLSTRRLRREKSKRNPLRILDDVPDRGGAGGGVRLENDLEALRPRTRAECRSGPRPCLFVSCRFHLYLDVNEETGSLKLNFPHLEPHELPESCALDLAERGGVTLEEIGGLLNVTRERARQLEEHGLRKLRRRV